MSRDHARPEGKPAPDAPPPVRAPSHAERCRTLAAKALSATLGTLARDPAGYPYTSLVTIAFDPSGRPLMLLSTLAEHTANLTADPRASLLVAEPLEGGREPLAIGRMTILGPCARVADGDRAGAREVFLAAQPSASYYVDFRDFDFFRLEPESIRYVGGFGRMSWVRGDEYRLAEPDALASSAAGILTHMNTDHADALVAYAKGLAGVPGATAATMTAVDRYGFEMAVTTPDGPRAVRLAFETECTTGDAVRRAMVALVKEARGKMTETVG
jgi:putative heme iron utilization protein